MKSLADLKKIRDAAKQKMGLRDANSRVKIVVGMGTSGIACGAREVMKAFLDEVASNNVSDVVVTQTGEKGLSSSEPLVDIIEKNKPVITYGTMDAEKAKRVFKEHILEGNPVSEYVISKG